MDSNVLKMSCSGTKNVFVFQGTFQDTDDGNRSLSDSSEPVVKCEIAVLPDSSSASGSGGDHHIPSN